MGNGDFVDIIAAVVYVLALYVVVFLVGYLCGKLKLWRKDDRRRQ